jgi:hypothetical protein
MPLAYGGGGFVGVWRTDLLAAEKHTCPMTTKSHKRRSSSMTLRHLNGLLLSSAGVKRPAAFTSLIRAW